MNSPVRTWLPILVFLFELSATPTADAAQYVVNGLALGHRVPLNSANYRAYTCKPSDNFDGYTWCQRTQQRNTSVGSGVLSSAILHAENGAVIYLMAGLAPVSIDREAVEKEIAHLSKELNELPVKVEWSPQLSGVPTSVIALWGRIKLQKITLDPYELKMIKAGKNLGRGMLVDSLSDLVRSAEAGLPVYRIAGGAGYVYSAGFDASGRGHRQYVAADVSPPAIEEFKPALRKILQNDQSRASNDYGLWPEVALVTRNLSLAASSEIADQELDKVFDKYPSKKLRSHVWSLLPLGSIPSLSNHVHWVAATYGPRTEYPEIRSSIQKFLAENPSEPFSEFLYYTIGEFEKALQANPNSVISTVVRYASGHQILESLLRDTAQAVQLKMRDTDEPVNDTLVTLNAKPELYGHKLLGSIVPNFAARAAAVQPWFEAVLRDESSHQRDDAAYMLGWLAFHLGKFKEALDYMSQAMTVGNRDYKRPAAMRGTVRILKLFPPREQKAIVESNSTFAKQPALWYVAARSAYRDFNFELAIDAGEQGLKVLKIPPDRLPATTDPEKIKEAIEKNLPQHNLKLDDDFDELNFVEIPYVVEASREMLQYNTYLKSVATDPPDIVVKKAREIILKYSMLLDQPEQPRGRRASRGPVHKDLRQAIRLIELTLESVPKSSQYAQLREWLYYRKVRILVQFAPKTVPEAVSAMEHEFPKSQLMDDALAEQLYAEGVRMGDVNAAQTTFQKLINNFPTGNAVDNAYTWMAIIYRCAGQVEKAQMLNNEILRRFPFTRHARYAVERISHPRANGCRLLNFSRG